MKKKTEKRVKLTRRLCTEFRVARATSGLIRKDVVGVISGLKSYNHLLAFEDYGKTSQKSVSYDLALSLLSFYKKYGYKSSTLKKLVEKNSYSEHRTRYMSYSVRQSSAGAGDIKERVLELKALVDKIAKDIGA